MSAFRERDRALFFRWWGPSPVCGRVALSLFPLCLGAAWRLGGGKGRDGGGREKGNGGLGVLSYFNFT